MEQDAYITTISEIKPHPNADKLELAMIKNWQCVIAKGSFKVGDKVLYIQPDAMILPPVEGVVSDWAEGIRRYLGSRGRVKIITLRGEISNGIIVDIENPLFKSSFAELLDSKCMPFMDISNIESYADMICDILGIGHYTPPIPQCMEAKSTSMPVGVEKSDETNFQSLDTKDLHLGETVLVTRKMDGSSGTLYYNPNTDELSIHSRSLSMYLDKDNNYTVAMRPYIEQVKALANYYKEPIAIRGEVCGNGVNSHKCNKDAKLPLGFYMYGIRFPEQTDTALKYGNWKSGRHFTDINKKLIELGMSPIPTVPILGEAVITMEQLRAWENAPVEDGEGVVVNGTWLGKQQTASYKAKSALYYAAMK